MQMLQFACNWAMVTESHSNNMNLFFIFKVPKSIHWLVITLVTIQMRVCIYCDFIGQTIHK